LINRYRRAPVGVEVRAQMDWLDVVIVLAAVAIVGWLLHAANVIGHNPYLRIKQHEELIGGRLPENMSMEEKQALLDRRGLAPRSAGLTVFKLAVVVLVATVLLWARR
jgi:hypothetical protein